MLPNGLKAKRYTKCSADSAPKNTGYVSENRPNHIVAHQKIMLPSKKENGINQIENLHLIIRFIDKNRGIPHPIL